MMFTTTYVSCRCGWTMCRCTAWILPTQVIPLWDWKPEPLSFKEARKAFCEALPMRSARVLKAPVRIRQNFVRSSVQALSMRIPR